MKKLVACVAVFASTFALDARAQQTLVSSDTFGRPNAWDAAKSPQVIDDFAVHVVARRLILQADELSPEGGMDASGSDGLAESMRARAYLLLAEAIGNGARDPRLQFDLGEVLYAQKREAAAAASLQKTLAEHPTGDGAHSAWLTYAFASSKLDRPDEERRAYEHFLADEPSPSRRAVPLLNLAEANMRAHKLTEAIDGYREVETLSASLAGNTETGVLAVWGLAIALDREGDARGAAEQARLASRMDPESPLRQKRPVIDSSGVYFVPAYEKFWYLALAATEDAKQAGSAIASAKAWGHAVALWEAYVEPAQTIDHPEAWNSVAVRHLAAAQKQLKTAEIAAKAEAKKKKPSSFADDPDNPTYTHP